MSSVGGGTVTSTLYDPTLWVAVGFFTHKTLRFSPSWPNAPLKAPPSDRCGIVPHPEPTILLVAEDKG